MNTYTTTGTHRATYMNARVAPLDLYVAEAQLEQQARAAYHDAQLHENELIRSLRFEQWLQATEAANRTLARIQALSAS